MRCLVILVLLMPVAASAANETHRKALIEEVQRCAKPKGAFDPVDPNREETCDAFRRLLKDAEKPYKPCSEGPEICTLHRNGDMEIRGYHCYTIMRKHRGDWKTIRSTCK